MTLEFIVYLLFQERLRIPKDPNEWTQPHVRHWLQWAVRQFNLVSIKLSDWNITGAQLCNMSQEEFNQKVPHDKDSIFWMHLEILKKFKTIGKHSLLSVQKIKKEIHGN